MRRTIRGRWQWALFGLAMIFLVSCSRANVNISDQLELGQKYLEEADYDQAIVAFSKVIQVDKRNVQANRQIAAAYEKVGKLDQAAEAMLNVLLSNEKQTEDMDAFCHFLEQISEAEDKIILAQMVYARTGDEKILPMLFAAKGEAGDMNGIKRLMEDVNQVNGMKDAYLETLVQNYYDKNDFDAMKELAQELEDTEYCNGMSLAVELLQEYKENGQEGVLALLETFYENEGKLPQIASDMEFYIGDRDENGLRDGYGICFYGSKVKNDSRIYAGYWKRNLRSGSGCAYRTADFRIQCQWEDDYPDGEVQILQNDITVLGTLAQGHVASSMNLYKDGEWQAVHCTPDDSMSSGYSFQTKDMDDKGNCGHVEKHAYCWDCAKKQWEEAGK